MNQAHLEVLASPTWAQMLETNLLPWMNGVADLGDDDAFLPMGDDTVAGRLGAAGSTDVQVELADHEFRFSARTPA